MKRILCYTTERGQLSVTKPTMPPKLNPVKFAKYKNRFVGKYLEKHAMKGVEQLIWSEGKYIEFLENVLDKVKLLQSVPEVCTSYS